MDPLERIVVIECQGRRAELPAEIVRDIAQGLVSQAAGYARTIAGMAAPATGPAPADSEFEAMFGLDRASVEARRERCQRLGLALTMAVEVGIWGHSEAHAEATWRALIWGEGQELAHERARAEERAILEREEEAAAEQAAMEREDLSEVIAILYGDRHGALRDAARDLDVDYDNLRKMLSGKRGVPAGLADALRGQMARRQVRPPLPGQPEAQREARCLMAIRPLHDQMIQRATEAGWTWGELRRALVELTKR